MTKISPLFSSEEGFDKVELVEILLFLESLLKNRIERTIILNIKEENDLVIAYIHFIINFLGKIKHAYVILQSYYEFSNDRKNINDPEFDDLDALILKEMIIDLVQKNLEDSSLCYKLMDTHNNSYQTNE